MLTWCHASSLSYDNINHFIGPNCQEQHPPFFSVHLLLTSFEYFKHRRKNMCHYSQWVVEFFLIQLILFNEIDRFSATSVSWNKQRGCNSVNEFTALSSSIHPDHCPFWTLWLCSISTLLFWTMYAHCLMDRLLHWRISKPVNSRPCGTTLSIPTHRVLLQNITSLQSYSAT